MLGLNVRQSVVLAAIFVFSAPVLAKDDTSNKTAYADKVVAARFAAIEGGYEKCAKLSDEARRTPHGDWRVHQLFATCTAFAADAQKDAGTIKPDAYAKRLQDAIGALQLLMQTPGVLNGHNQRQSVSFVIEQLGKRIKSAQQSSAN